MRARPLLAAVLAMAAAATLGARPLDLPPPDSGAAAVIVVDPATGMILHEKNADARRVPASTQKLLSALLIVDRGGLDEMVRISAADTRVVPSKLWLQAGQRYTRRQLLEALLVKSANDAAMALARDHSGSVDGFAAAMNERAWQLGCRNSRFVNPHGLTADRQYSSARDLSLIAQAAYAEPTIREIVGRRSIDFEYDGGAAKSFENTNKVLLESRFCTGMKTGFTTAAGYCLVASGQVGARELLTIVLGAGAGEVWRDSHRLLTWGLGIRVRRERQPDAGDQPAAAADDGGRLAAGDNDHD